MTLEESVMQQYRAFRPDQILGFQWIPGTTRKVQLSATTVAKFKVGSNLRTKVASK